jgi:hypothetical protein
LGFTMDILAMILTCSVYPDDHLIRAMVELASQENPHFVGDLVTLVTFDRPGTLPDAQRVVSELERRGGKPVVGLLGVPMSWAARYNKKPADLFEGCANLLVGSSVLQSHYEACSSSHSATLSSTPAQRHTRVAPPEAIRLCALRRYGADLGIDGYAESALKYFSRQRVLFAAGPDDTTPAAADPGCRCSEPPAPRKPAAPARPRLSRVNTDTWPPSKGPGGAPILD